MRLHSVLRSRHWRFEGFSFFYIPVAGRLSPFDHWTTTRRPGSTLTIPAHMAQLESSTHGLLLAESTSIEYVPRLSPPTPRNVSYSSTSSIDSAANYSPQGEASEGAASASPTSTLPTFYPSGSRDATPSSNPDKTPRNWPDIILHGWRVVLLSCMPFLGSSFHHLTMLCFKGLNIFLVLIPLSVRSTRSFVLDRQLNLHLSTIVGDDPLLEKHA